MVDWQQVNKQTKIFSFEGRKCLGKVVDVYDGDTVKIVFSLSDNEPERLYKWNCRLINVDTPEIKTKNLKEKAYAKEVRNGQFPAEDNFYAIKEEELEQLLSQGNWKHDRVVYETDQGFPTNHSATPNTTTKKTPLKHGIEH